MDSEFAAVPRRLKDLFADPYHFQVPSFQRPYSWTTREAGQLLDDLLADMGEEEAPAPKSYFLGSIVLISPGTGAQSGAGRANGSKTAGSYAVIDGHQRLVTLTILMAGLRDLMAEDGLDPQPLHDLIGASPQRYRLQLQPNDNDFFRFHVQDAGECHVMPGGDTDELPKSQQNIIANRECLLHELADLTPEHRQRFARFIAEHCFVVVITTDCMDSAYRLFTVLNNRGRPLARNDILKADLIGAVPAAEQARTTKLWDKQASRLGDNFEILFSHIRSIHGRAKAPVITEIANIARLQGPQRFLDETFRPLAEIYARLLAGGPTGPGFSAEIRRCLTYLGWLRSQDWMPAALLWMQIHGEDSQRTADFLQRLDRFTYGLNLLGLGSEKRITRHRAVVAAIHAGTILDPKETALALDRDEQRTILYNLSRNLHRRNQQACKLVLLRLNDEFSGQMTGIDPGEVTVEHVLPLRPSRGSEWSEWFSDAEVREYCTNCLGNLILISQAQNEAAANKDFAVKRAIYFGTGFDSRWAITDMIRDDAEWRAPQVAERDEALMERLKTFWQFEGPSGYKQTKEAEPPPRARRRERQSG